MKPILPLTELKLRNSQAKSKTYKIFDGNGLYLEVLPSGTKSWRLVLRIDGKEKRITLGRWPDMGLKAARDGAAKRRNGEVEKKAEMTVNELCESWMTVYLSRVSKKEAARKRYFVKNYIAPPIGELPLGKLTPPLILGKVLRPVEALGYLESAHRVKSVMSQILRYGVGEGFVERDFTLDLRGCLAPVAVTHRAAIFDQKKIGRLLMDIKEYMGTPSVAYALRILPYVFTRPGELRRAEWSEIDFDERVWRIPAEKMKMRSQHLVPLSDQVAAWMLELREHTGGGRLLFPGVRSIDKPISDVTINAALRYLGYGKDQITGHGFRAMASTLLNERGYNSDWIERQLAHVERNGVRAAYNHADYLPERRKMMQDWADLLDSLALDVSFR